MLAEAPIHLPIPASFFALAIALSPLQAAEDGPLLPAGVARVEITPAYPVRLSGYGGRRAESQGTEQRLWAKALAFGADAPRNRRREPSESEGPVVLVTVDNLGVPASIVEEVAGRLQKLAGLRRERFAVASSHTHSAPMLTGACPTLFGEDIPPEHQERIDRYSRELADSLERAALAALHDRRPARLDRATGAVGFARNRRTDGGPTDHRLPVLRVSDPSGAVRAILLGYACHATTLGGEFNSFCGDWVGYAQELTEAAVPGATVLVSIGCGADANPHPRGKLEDARDHGREIAAEVERLLASGMRPLGGPIACRLDRIALPFDALPDRAGWEKRARTGGAVGYHARRNLARLDRGEALPAELEYPVQTWSFGKELAMVFLAGEVVVDYALRLQRELDRERLWITAYANDFPCYIPSRRVLAEGGYEGGDAMVYFDRPTRFAPAVEDRIVDTVHRLVPKEFNSEETNREFPPPLSPEESLATIRVREGLRVELAAAEPQVFDPVAIDFGTDGRLWVAEMADYPEGIDGQYTPGGRVVFLRDPDRDGRYDRRTVFLEGLPFPTGVMAWREGVLVCAAPDIIYAEDTDGDGKAGRKRVLFTGFATHNYQARVNGLSWGLDGWVHGAGGLFGGPIRGSSPGGGGGAVELSGRDFRLLPDEGVIEPAAGLSQQGRPRDDWDGWFGNENWFLLRHYPLPDRYVRRNPHVGAPNPRVDVPADADPNRLFPASFTLRRFNDEGSRNRTTSACGPGIYRDDLLGAQYAGNAFVCEPVHNLVTRLVLEPAGATWRGKRDAGEREREFLAAADNWFRPVEAVTGPDGALWVVDMYRFVIEHPRWIAPERLALLDVRAGSDRGRIYRVLPAAGSARPIADLSALDAPSLAAAIESPNGPARDLAHRELAHRQDRFAAPVLERIARESPLPAARLQALCALESLHSLGGDLIAGAIADRHPRVRAGAIRLAEPLLRKGGGAAPAPVTEALLARAADPDPAVSFQLALTLGEWPDPRAGAALGRLAVAASEDPWQRAAILSSATPHAASILEALASGPGRAAERSAMEAPLIATAAAECPEAELPRVLASLLARDPAADGSPPASRDVAALASFLDAVGGRGVSLESLERSGDAAQGAAARARRVIEAARRIAERPPGPAAGEGALEAALEADSAARAAATALLLREAEAAPRDRAILARLLSPSESETVRRAALGALVRSGSPEAGKILLEAFEGSTPALRAAILEAFLARALWAEALLAAVEAGRIPPAAIDASFRARLLARPEEPLRARAEKALRALGEKAPEGARAGGDRKSIVERYRPALSLGGSQASGALVFGKLCAPCHRFRAQGQAVGPDLSALKDKEAEFYLVSLLDPNAAVEDKYRLYAAGLRDGRLVTGMLTGESATTLRLVGPNGSVEEVLRKDLLSLRNLGISLMPEGLEESLSPAELADLLAYLRSGPRLLGSTGGEMAAAARQRFFAEGSNGLERVLAAFDVFQQPSWLGTVTMHYCRQNSGEGLVRWRTAPAPSPLSAAALQPFRFAAAMGWRSQPPGSFALRLDGKVLLEFNVTLEDAVFPSADGRSRLSYTVLESNGEDSTGVMVLEVPGDLLKPGEAAVIEVRGSAAGSERWFGLLDPPPPPAKG